MIGNRCARASERNCKSSSGPRGPTGAGPRQAQKEAERAALVFEQSIELVPICSGALCKLVRGPARAPPSSRAESGGPRAAPMANCRRRRAKLFPKLTKFTVTRVPNERCVVPAAAVAAAAAAFAPLWDRANYLHIDWRRRLQMSWRATLSAQLAPAHATSRPFGLPAARKMRHFTKFAARKAPQTGRGRLR